jgi:predicted TIM-barrel enzyme
VEQVRESKAVSGERAKLFIGSGMTAENVKEFLPFIDGCIVGTAFKKTAERIAGGPNVFGPEVRYDVQKVRTFVQSVHGA